MICYNFRGGIQTTNNLATDQHLWEQLFRKHAVSASLSMAGVQLCTMINSVLAGKFFGSSGLAVMSIVSPIYSVYAGIGALTGIGGAIITSHSLGHDDKNEANERFTCALIICLILSAIFSSVGLIFEEKLLTLLGMTDATANQSESYATIYLLGGFCTALFYLPYHFLKLAGQLKYLITIFLGMAILNFVFDWILCQNFGMRMNGIALGTVLSSLVTSAIGIYVLIRDSFKLKNFSSLKHLRRLLKFGTPSMLNQILNFIRFIIMNNLLLIVAGHVGLVIFSVVRTLESLSNIVLAGISQSTSAFVGLFFQERDNESIRVIERFAIKISVELILIMMALIWIFPDQICDLFKIEDSDERFYAIDAIKIFSWSLLPATICMILTSYYQSTEFPRLANIVTLSRGFFLLLIPAYFLSKEYGINGIWYSFVFASIATLFILLLGLFLYHNYHKFVNDFHDRSRFLRLDLQAENEGRYINFDVETNVQAIVDSVEKIGDFCVRNNLSEKEIMLIRLSMEEMMMSIKDHCFPPDANEILSVRIFINNRNEDPEIVLRIRNGGELFNPIDYFKRMEKHDPESFALTDALGIMMISKAADEIHYKTTLGINNLAIVIKRDKNSKEE